MSGNFPDFEKLGTFYLGKEYDLANRERTENLVLYDSRDLCTHAVVVGMTGSGKTGLCVGLLEEAGMDNIPAIVIDPKGDIANLLLTFPELTAESFRPWIDEGQAARKNLSPEDFAAQEAEKWKAGLKSWGQDGDRIRQFRDKVELRIYTPGSTAGRPMTILKSFAAPSQAVIDDTEALLDRIDSAVSGLLALLGIDADPVQSREHILICKILEHAWRESRDLNLGQLISEIQTPPFEKVGVMEVDTVFPKKDRQALAMTLNNLLASPTFASWLEGEPLDVKRMLHNQDGKPVISVVSIAHLSDPERMFFVTILLNEVLSWMRGQPGTSSLRALLYMDEVFGYFPPTQNPPSKKPMLTLLKQARAFGVGCVLATQNPVDLDYKGLSNAGTWFLGRLQTERDKARVLEGLEGASTQAGSKFNRSDMERTLAGLGSRVFLMNNVHEDEPVVFETRWVMSYLRGPLARKQLQELVDRDPNFDPNANKLNQHPKRPAQESVEQLEPQVDQRQMIDPDVQQFFVRSERAADEGEKIVYRPVLIGVGRLHFVRVTYKVDDWEQRTFIASLSGGELPDEVWEKAERAEKPFRYQSDPDPRSEFAKIPAEFEKSKNFRTWERELKAFLYRSQRMTVWKCENFKVYSKAEESLGDFKVRLEQRVSEERDEQVDRVRKKYASKFSSLRDRIRRAEDKVEKEKEQYKQTRMSSVLSVGTTIMGALLGRKKFSVTNARKAEASVRSMGRSSKEKADIDRAREDLAVLIQKFEELETEFNRSLDEIAEKTAVESLEFTELKIKPRKSDISIRNFGVCWLPWLVDENGIAEPNYE
jgi:hypothetical protein